MTVFPEKDAALENQIKKGFVNWQLLHLAAIHSWRMRWMKILLLVMSKIIDISGQSPIVRTINKGRTRPFQPKEKSYTEMVKLTMLNVVYVFCIFSGKYGTQCMYITRCMCGGCSCRIFPFKAKQKWWLFIISALALSQRCSLVFSPFWPFWKSPFLSPFMAVLVNIALFELFELEKC